MPINNPTQLVDEFKKSGEFDRLRRELVNHFQRSDDVTAFKSRIEDIARQQLLTDQKLQYMPPESIHTELMQEIDRYPIVERAVAGMQSLSEQSFMDIIGASLQKILCEHRKQQPLVTAKRNSSNDILHQPLQSTTSRVSERPINQMESDSVSRLQGPNVIDVSMQPNVQHEESSMLPVKTSATASEQVTEAEVDIEQRISVEIATNIIKSRDEVPNANPELKAMDSDSGADNRGKQDT